MPTLVAMGLILSMRISCHWTISVYSALLLEHALGVEDAEKALSFGNKLFPETQFENGNNLLPFSATICCQCGQALSVVVQVPPSALQLVETSDLVVPRTTWRLGNRTFCVASPTEWNSLPSDIQTVSSVTTFKNLLKTHLFTQSYYST